MSDYSQGKIYIIKSKNSDDVYIGSTKHSLEERYFEHMTHYHKHLRTNKKYVSSFEVIKYGDTFIELLEEYPCNNRQELCRKEGEYQKNMECVNKKIAGRTEKEWREDNIESIAEYRKEYNSKPEIKEQKKEYDKEYASRPEVKEHRKEHRKERYEQNKDIILEKQKQHRLEPEIKQSRIQYGKEYNSRPEVKERQKEYHKEYNSRPEVKERNKERSKEYEKRGKIKIMCVCGSEHRKADTRRHEKTQKHINYIDKMKENADSTNLNEFFEQVKFKLTTN